MSFRIPAFPLLANIWHGGAIPPAGAPDIAAMPCQLARDMMVSVLLSGANLIWPVLLRVPAGTDLRGSPSTTGKDVAEIPAGTGRYYYVWQVEDVAKGFPNEYRSGLLTLQACPTPLP